MPNRSRLIARGAFAAGILTLGALSVASPRARGRVAWDLPGRVATAQAQEVMQFEEVPAESAAAMEKRARGSAPRHEPHPPVEAVHPEVPEPPRISRAGDVVRIGSDIHVEENQVVEGDVFALQGDIRVDGRIKGNVATTGGDVHLGPHARVDGDVMCIGGTLVEEPGAVVGGQRVTALGGSGDRRRISEKIRGRISERIRRPFDRWDGDRGSGRGLGFALSWLIVTMLVAWAVTKFMPDRTGVALATLKRDPGASLAFGFLIILLLIPSVVALALAMAVLCITIIGIPLALLLMPAYAVVLAVLSLWGFAVGVTMVGERLESRMGGPASLSRAALMGVLAVSGMLLASSIVRALPFFGWIATLLWVLGFVTFGFTTMAGAGALLRSKFGQGPGGRWWPPFGPASPSRPATVPGSATPVEPAPPPAADPPPAL